MLRARGFHLLRLCWRGQTGLVFIYHPGLLKNALSQDAVQRALTSMGYPAGKDVQALLSALRRRFHESDEFPHEIGFFLGYPPEDVIGFIECRMDCKLCGQWKVFGDAEQAAALFDEYARCKRTLLRHIENGGSIFTADLPALAG